MRPTDFFPLLLLLVTPVLAQFNFFGNMFGGQQHQEPQNMGSDSEWYQQNYDGGESTKIESACQNLVR